MGLMMIKNVLGFVKIFLDKFWREMLIVSLMGSIFYLTQVETRYLFGMDTIPYLQNQNDELLAGLATCANGNELLTSTIKTRNDEIGEWKEVSDKLEQKNKRLYHEIGKLRGKTNAKVTGILSGSTPESCDAAFQYLRDSAVGDLTCEE